MGEVRPQFIMTFVSVDNDELTVSKNTAREILEVANKAHIANKIKSFHKFQGGKITEVYPVIHKGVLTLKEEPYVISPPLPEPAKETLAQYREDIKRTMNKDLKHKDKMAMLALGLSGEVGELVDMVKKFSYHGHTLEKPEVVKEFGDIYWYIHNLMNELELSHEEIMETNIKKLQKRYPQGFSEQASQRRVDTTEKYFLDSAVEYSKHKSNTLGGNKPC